MDKLKLLSIEVNNANLLIKNDRTNFYRKNRIE